MLRAILFLVLALFAGCASNPPLEEYTLAKTALDAAQNSGANKYAPGYWFKAEETYRQGEVAFRNGQFEESKELFVQSKNFSEKSENKARFDRAKSGEDFP